MEKTNRCGAWLFINKTGAQLLKLHAWEVALESLRRRELVPLHVVEVLSTMVVRANGQQLRHVSFRLNTQKRLGDIEY
jgi:hypothetical protein